MAHSFISIKKFSEEPYSKVLGYPNATNRQINARIKELEKLKIKSICLTGSTLIGNLEILGKGYVGVVVLVKRGNKEVALKIRRTDSQRENMKKESILLKLVNSVDVGPKIIDVSKNFLVMEYLEGEKFSDWIEMLKGKGSTKKLKITIKDILEDCYRLDQIGFDHGELSNISKHVIVGKNKATIHAKKVDGKEVSRNGESFYKISNVDGMRPFFMSIVSNSDHWMFISSKGSLSAGRKNSNYALFPYYTDDKITEAAEITGSKSIFLVSVDDKKYLWEPFSDRYAGIYNITRNLYKNIYGNKIIFEEINHD